MQRTTGLPGLPGLATDVVQSAMERGDQRIAFRFLHGMRALQPPTGPKDGAELRPAVEFIRWSVTINDPGIRPEAIEAYLMKRHNAPPRVAGNLTYMQCSFPWAYKRSEADALAKGA